MFWSEPLLFFKKYALSLPYTRAPNQIAGAASQSIKSYSKISKIWRFATQRQQGTWLHFPLVNHSRTPARPPHQLSQQTPAMSFYSDNSIGDKPSSRVLAPPGGKSSIFFSDEPAAAPRASTQLAERNKSQFSLGPRSPQGPVKQSDCQVQRNKSSVFGSKSPLKPANAAHSSALGKFNHNAPSESVYTAKPSTRVINPPGGRSSNIFG
eukprot:m.130654 g.130654  ORF g.130654 m.130654 type:complete len:209 (-) comp52354_c0_seq1:157-783(-)